MIKIYKKSFISILFLSSIISSVSNSHASQGDYSEANKCLPYLAQYERKYSIPEDLLRAVSLKESGKTHEGKKVSWPWAINAEGQGYFADSKAEAVRKVRHLKNSGVESIDVGCMQISLKYHPDAFDNLEEAFDPKSNVEYAAKFLRSHYDRTKDWKKAVAAYHSITPQYGIPYAKHVMNIWSNVSDNPSLKSANINPPAQAKKKAPQANSNIVLVYSSGSGSYFGKSSGKRIAANQAVKINKKEAISRTPMMIQNKVPYTPAGNIYIAETNFKPVRSEKDVRSELNRSVD